MPISKELKESLEDLSKRLNSVETALHLRPKDQGWWRTRWEWIVDNKGTSIVLAIILCLVSIVGGGYFVHWLERKDEWWNEAVDKRVRTVLEAKGGINETLAGIQQTVTATDSSLKTLAPFIQDVIRHQFESTAGLPTSVFKERLPAIQHLVAVARDQATLVNPATVSHVADKLLTVQPRPADFWPTASELINYRSFLSSPQQYVKITFQMRNCDPHPARDVTINFPPGPKVTGRNVLSIVQTDCFLDLDEHNEIEDYKCQKCVIKYSGGPLTLKAPVEFIDCLFAFSIHDQPATPSGVLLAETLLSKNPQDIKIPQS